MSNYKVFTKEYDQVMHMSEYKEDFHKQDPEMLNRLKVMLDPFMTNIDIEISDPEEPRTFLLDCSGSMRGKTIVTLIAGMVETGNALHKAGTPFEILGHTTAKWKGGQPYQDWMNVGRPENPGRLNELLLYVIKERDEPWPEARENLLGLLHEKALKENIDGEAIEWASERMRAHEQPGKLVILSDGTPMDDATNSFNNIDLLKNHLREVIEQQKSIGLDFDVVAINNGYGFPDSAYPEYHSVDMRDTGKQHENTVRMITQIQAAMSNPKSDLSADSAGMGM